MAGRHTQDADKQLVAKLIRWPADWIERIDAVRGEQSFSDFVRSAVFPLIDNDDLSDAPQWGQAPAVIMTAEQVVEEIRLAAEQEVNGHTTKRTA